MANTMPKAKLALICILFAFCSSLLPAQERHRVLIDTDPAMGYLFRDIDDGLMLVAALSSPELDVAGITTTGGNIGVGATTRKALEIVEVLSRTDVPVVSGAPFSSTEPADNAAARFIAQIVLSDPGATTVLATGPLTNVADAIQLHPDVASSIGELIIVGGHIVEPDGVTRESPYDMNFGSDPAALRTVLESQADVTLIHIELCLEFMTRNGQFRSLLDHAGTLSGYLRAQTRSWRLIRSGNFVLWDVVALNYLLHPEWYTTVQMGVRTRVEYRQRVFVWVEADETFQRKVRLPMAIANTESYWDWLADQLEQAGVYHARQ